MNKLEQKKINGSIMVALEKFNNYKVNNEVIDAKKLRTCTAKVYTFEKYYVLVSYNTVVAFIDRETDTLYDILRYMYGYTSTSAQHISKFEHDYCKGKWSCADRYTYREI